MRLWRVTDDEYYLRESYVYLASFFHNCVIWESEIANAAKYKVFLGATCLHDAPVHGDLRMLRQLRGVRALPQGTAVPDLDPAVRLLVSEYCKYALDRAWYYYPDALPADALAKDDIRNGHIDRKLSFPVEDLYVDGQPAGQVGQEIYGAGAAFVFASRSFHEVSGAPFRIFCDHFPVTSERTSERSLNFGLDGGHARQAVFSLIRETRARMPRFTLRTMAGERLRPHRRDADLIEFRIPASGEISPHW